MDTQQQIVSLNDKMVPRKHVDKTDESTLLLAHKSSASSSTRLTIDSSDGQKICLRRCWIIHFVLAIVVLNAGMFHNHNPTKKYLKVNPSLVEVPDQTCTTAYLNVMASSSKADDATICCTTKNNSSNSHIDRATDSSVGTGICMSIFNNDVRPSLIEHMWNFVTLQADICTDKSQTFPFVRQLSKFPDAWLLPLFPLLFRLLYCIIGIIMKFVSKKVFATIQSNETNNCKSMIYIVRRFCFYFVLFNLRGWVLYILLNKVEDQFIRTVIESSGTNCWYMIEGWFPQNSEEGLCAGRRFDFSDHIVLYYAQILPIALFETLHIIIESPCWYLRAITPESDNQKYNGMVFGQRFINQVFRWFVLVILIGMHIYLQIITSSGAYKTSIYFHTPFEITTGFILSMTISVPLCLLQCQSNLHPALSYVRSILLEA